MSIIFPLRQVISQKTTFSIIQWECTDSGAGISENRVLVLRHWGANIPLRPAAVGGYWPLNVSAHRTLFSDIPSPESVHFPIVKEIKIDYSTQGVRIFSDILSPIWPWISFVLQNLGILINIPKFCIVKIFPYKIWRYWSISPNFDSKNIALWILGILINIPRFCKANILHGNILLPKIHLRPKRSNLK